MIFSPLTESNKNAHQYCHTIADELLVLEKLLSGGVLFDENLEDDQRELWVELAEEAGEEPSRYCPALMDYVSRHCLGFVTLGKSSSSHGAGVRLLRTYGGPNAFIEYRGDGSNVSVEVYWGREFVSAQLVVPNVAKTLGELANLAANSRPGSS